MVRMPHWPIPLSQKIIDLELNRVKNLLEALGNPHLKLPPVIHIAGTNGKGSTSAFLKSIFKAAGLKAHCYTSPHLVNFNERIVINGLSIEDNFLFEVLEESRVASEKNNIEPTFFEGTTVAAFLAFSKIPADVIILEVGLGGRLDATNVIDNPAVTIITSVSYDHMEYLGSDLIQIACEKAGIIKNNCPVVISQQYENVMDALLEIAQQRNAKTIAFEYDWMVNKKDGNQFEYLSKDNNLLLPNPSLVGDHQFINAGNAISACLELKQFSINDKMIAAGISNAYWPARLQKLVEGEIINKLPRNFEVWVDGAHNDAGAYVLANWLGAQEKKPTYLLFGMTKGRDCKKFLSNFISLVDHVTGILIENEPSSYGGEYIAKEASELGFTANSFDDIEEFFFDIAKTEKNQARIIVTGSLYLAGDVLYKNQRFVR